MKDPLQRSADRMADFVRSHAPTAMIERELEILVARLTREYPKLLETKPFLKDMVDQYERFNQSAPPEPCDE